MTPVHIDLKLEHLQVKLSKMRELVEYQFYSTREAIISADKELAYRVVKLGKKVNDLDVKIDRMSKKLLALYTPVAIDLRLVLATLKINANPENTGSLLQAIHANCIAL